MRVPHQSRRPAPVSPGTGRRAPDRPAGPAGSRIETLQRSVGNRAVAQLLAVQREPTAEQKKVFDGYFGRDWGRAAWVLNDWLPGDIADRIKKLSAADLESLNEGAWHGGKGNVDTAVRALNRTAAARGALRVLMWGKRWAEAAKQLDQLDRADALAYVRSRANQGAITGDELRQLVKPGSLRLRPGGSIKIDGRTYIVYATTVRFDGDIPWRNHNPGALRPPEEIPSWGYLGRDPEDFLIFPDMSTGEKASKANLEHQATANGNRSILETMQNYANDPTDKPDVYAQKIVDALRGQVDKEKKPITAATLLNKLEPKQLETVKQTIHGTEKTAGTKEGKVGGEEPHDSTKLPEALRDLLRK